MWSREKTEEKRGGTGKSMTQRQLRDIRWEAGFTQAELAACSSMTRQNISRMERGEYMSFEAARQLSSVFNMEALTLLVEHNLAVIEFTYDVKPVFNCAQVP